MDFLIAKLQHTKVFQLEQMIRWLVCEGYTIVFYPHILKVIKDHTYKETLREQPVYEFIRDVLLGMAMNPTLKTPELNEIKSKGKPLEKTINALLKEHCSITVGQEGVAVVLDWNRVMNKRINVFDSNSGTLIKDFIVRCRKANSKFLKTGEWRT